MCDSPVLVRNPNCKRLNRAYQYLLKKNPNYKPNDLRFLKDTTNHSIYVPCGHCPSCTALRQSYLIQRVQMEELVCDLFFCTLTYSNKMIPSVNANGYNLYYADVKDIQNLFKRLRNYDLLGPKFSYICCSEFGGLRHRPHWHILFAIPADPSETLADKLDKEKLFHDIVLSQWVRNFGSKRSPDYKPLCDYRCTRRGRNFDFHYINPSSTNNGTSDVAYYVTKYVTKSNPYVRRLKSALYYNTPDDSSFNELWNMVRPRLLMSKHFGLGYSSQNSKQAHPLLADYIKRCIADSVSDNDCFFPRFRNPVSGAYYPLSPYYRDRFMSIDDYLTFFYRRPLTLNPNDGSAPAPSTDYLDSVKKDYLNNSKLMSIELRDNYIDYSLDDFSDDDLDSFIDCYPLDIPRIRQDNSDLKTCDDFKQITQLKLFTNES